MKAHQRELKIMAIGNSPGGAAVRGGIKTVLKGTALLRSTQSTLWCSWLAIRVRQILDFLGSFPAASVSSLVRSFGTTVTVTVCCCDACLCRPFFWRNEVLNAPRERIDPAAALLLTVVSTPLDALVLFSYVAESLRKART